MKIKMSSKSAKRVLRENQMPDENCYSVFYKDGDEANDYYLSKRDALELAMNLEDDGYEVIVAKDLGNDWETIYETK